MLHTEKSEICESSITEFDVEIFESIHNLKSSLKIHAGTSVQEFNEGALSIAGKIDDGQKSHIASRQRDLSNNMDTTGEYTVGSAQKKKEK